MATSNNDPSSGLSTTESQNQRMNEERSFLDKLLQSALSGNTSKVKHLTEEYSNRHNISVEEVLGEFKDGNRRTALHFACQSSPNEGANEGANEGTNEGTSEGTNEEEEEEAEEDIVISLASWLGSPSLEKLARAKDRDGLTPLMLAAQLSDKPLSHKRISCLLSFGGNKLALARSHAGATALHYAAGSGAGRDSILLLYQAARVAVQTASKQGGTPLHWAATGSNIDTLRSLVDDCHADIDSKNTRGFTSLVLAAAAGNDRNACFLVTKGADATCTIQKGVTLFHMAADLNLVETLRALLHRHETHHEPQCRCYDERNQNGETPLELAAKEGHLRCVMLLLPEGQNTEQHAKTYIADRLANPPQQQQQQQQRQEPDSSSPNTDNTTNSETIQEKATQIANEALQKSETASQQTKQKAERHKLDGNRLFSQHKYSDAIREYTHAIQTDPGDATYYSNRSACHVALKSYEIALEDAIVVTILKPTWVKGWYRVAVAKLALEWYEDAAVAAWEGLKLRQDSVELKELMKECVERGRKDFREMKLQQQQRLGAEEKGENVDDIADGSR